MGEGLPAQVRGVVPLSLLPPGGKRGSGHLWSGALQVVHVPGDVEVVQPTQVPPGGSTSRKRPRAKDGSGGFLLSQTVARDEGGRHLLKVAEALPALHFKERTRGRSKLLK